MMTSLTKLSKLLHLHSRKMVENDDQFLDFPLLAPKSYLARIKPRDINDPLLSQILPSRREFEVKSGFNIDPLSERKSSPVPGLIHKYYGRVLLLVTDKCAINCRFCFRRHSHSKIKDWSQVFAYIKNNPSITEVILSGGDPLLLTTEELNKIMAHLAAMPQIARIRIHSRLPIVMPERITVKLFNSKLPVILVVHCNHPNEINAKVAKAISLLRKQNLSIFNQSVLLRKINDNSQTLIELSEKLFSIGVIPYYLHILDKVQGAAHFHVAANKAKQLYTVMQNKLPGYLVPKLVMEIKNRKKYV